MKASQITFANEVIDLSRSRLKWPQLQYFRNKRQITRWPTQSLWTVRTFATCDKFNPQFSILSCRCRQNHFAHVPLTILSMIIILTIKSMTMTVTFTSMTMTLTKFDYIFTVMITPMIRRGDSKRNREKQRRRSSRAACWWGWFASYSILKIILNIEDWRYDAIWWSSTAAGWLSAS